MVGLGTYFVFVVIVFLLLIVGYMLFLKELAPFLKTKKIIFSKEGKSFSFDELENRKKFFEFLRGKNSEKNWIEKFIHYFRTKILREKDNDDFPEYIGSLGKLRNSGGKYELLLYWLVLLFITHFIYLASEYKLEYESKYKASITITLEEVEKNVNGSTEIQAKYGDSLIIYQEYLMVKDSSFQGSDSLYVYDYLITPKENAEVDDKTGSILGLVNSIIDDFSDIDEEISLIKTDKDLYRVDVSGYKLTKWLNILIVLFVLSLTIVSVILIINIARRYRKRENYILAVCSEGSEVNCLIIDDSKILIKENNDYSKNPITLTGNAIVNKINPEWGNNILGLVYFGAAFLVIVVGLRGLGEQINKIEVLVTLNGILQGALIEAKGVKLGLIFIALIFEFTMLCLLAITKFFEPENERESEQDLLKPSNSLLTIKFENLITERDINNAKILIGYLDRDYSGQGSRLRNELNEIVTVMSGIKSKTEALEKYIKNDITEIKDETKPNITKTIVAPLKNDIDKINGTLKGIETSLNEIKTTFSK